LFTLIYFNVFCKIGSNLLAVGYDEGTVVLKLGSEEPAVSMDSSGKIIWAKHNEIQTANLKAVSGLFRFFFCLNVFVTLFSLLYFLRFVFSVFNVFVFFVLSLQFFTLT
jgi:hypothetical protein